MQASVLIPGAHKSLGWWCTCTPALREGLEKVQPRHCWVANQSLGELWVQSEARLTRGKKRWRRRGKICNILYTRIYHMCARAHTLTTPSLIRNKECHCVCGFMAFLSPFQLWILVTELQNAQVISSASSCKSPWFTVGLCRLRRRCALVWYFLISAPIKELSCVLSFDAAHSCVFSQLCIFFFCFFVSFACHFSFDKCS